MDKNELRQTIDGLHASVKELSKENHTLLVSHFEGDNGIPAISMNGNSRAIAYLLAIAACNSSEFCDILATATHVFRKLKSQTNLIKTPF
jgi:hypothetical protein